MCNPLGLKKLAAAIVKKKKYSSINEIGFDIDQTRFLGSHECDMVHPALQPRVVRISQQ